MVTVSNLSRMQTFLMPVQVYGLVGMTDWMLPGSWGGDADSQVTTSRAVQAGQASADDLTWHIPG
jgi:hypothetical protein